ncbi:hypothetical protein [Richelia intracellularis]|uniref:hypothetical protein n=1 Tax=Richelia intracellularis TaxID=1164990 RepID=UPI0005C7D9E7|nr:hypothetical protein [Richelia intracellularis]HAE06182.1 hypothetical protein [Richelia sp.]
MKLITLIILSLQIITITPTAYGNRCETINAHKVCIVDLKRSPKRYWNYRVSISIDEEKQPVEIYNCRSQFKIQQDGKIVFFEENSPGKFICRNFKY